MAENIEKLLVVDIGSDSIKAGYVGSESPVVVFPTVVGHQSKSDGNVKELYVGNAAQDRTDILSLSYPIEYGKIKNWDDIESIWSHIFYKELKISPENCPILMTESILNTKEDREQMVESMFEKFHFQSLYICVQQLLSLAITGRNSGVLVDMGHDATHVVPVIEGYAFPNCTNRMNVGGKDLTDYLMKAIAAEHGPLHVSMQDRYQIRNMKEKHCFVALDYEKEVAAAAGKRTAKVTHQLLSGQDIVMDIDRFRCPEGLIQPHIIDKECEGLHTIIHDTVMKSEGIDADLEDLEATRQLLIREDLFANIVLSGGSSLFPGLSRRLQRELCYLAPAQYKVKVISPANSRFSAWLGASMLGSVESFRDHEKWITRAMYEEYGPGVVHRLNWLDIFGELGTLIRGFDGGNIEGLFGRTLTMMKQFDLESIFAID